MKTNYIARLWTHACTNMTKLLQTITPSPTRNSISNSVYTIFEKHQQLLTLFGSNKILFMRCWVDQRLLYISNLETKMQSTKLFDTREILANFVIDDDYDNKQTQIWTQMMGWGSAAQTTEWMIK